MTARGRALLAAQASAAAAPTPAWLMPVAVGVGALALFALFAPKKRATPNRRRHR